MGTAGGYHKYWANVLPQLLSAVWHHESLQASGETEAPLHPALEGALHL